MPKSNISFGNSDFYKKKFTLILLKSNQISVQFNKNTRCNSSCKRKCEFTLYRGFFLNVVDTCRNDTN